MPYALPSFNLVLDIWDPGNTPIGGPADHVGVPGQIYLNSKGLLDITPGNDADWVPPINIRVEKTSVFILQGSIIEDPATALGGYYRVRWGCRTHAGFPNEYLTFICELCDGNGTPTFNPS